MEPLDRADISDALFGPQVFFAPIRHHSPASAWMLRAMIDEIQPSDILIEAPADFERHLPHLTDPETRLPVAVVALLGSDSPTDPLRHSSYWPFARHSPEYIAITDGTRLNAKICFIDLPSGQRSALYRALTDDEGEELEAERHPELLMDEHRFGSDKLMGALAKAYGSRDRDELWDTIFETQLGQTDWRKFFTDLYGWCLAVREATPEHAMRDDGTYAREAHMRKILDQTKNNASGPILVVTGGFHTPALISEDNLPVTDKVPKTEPSESFLIGYSEDALDALSGYAAGLARPGFYAGLWDRAVEANGAPDWSRNAQGLISDFLADHAKEKTKVSMPEIVEAQRVTTALAAFRGRPGPLRHDIEDGLRTALNKGETANTDPWSIEFRRWLAGDAMGAAPRAAGAPPLLKDARQIAERNGIDLEATTPRRRKLDIRRSDRHATLSRFLYQMQLIDASPGRLLTGPDYVNGHNTSRLFEEWEIAWSPFVEGALISASSLGATLHRAALNALLRKRSMLRNNASENTLPNELKLFLNGMRAGLGPDLHVLADEIAADLRVTGDFRALADVLRQLQILTVPGTPIYDPEGPDISVLAARAYDRFLFLAEDFATLPDEARGHALNALSTVDATLRTPLGNELEIARLHRVMDRLLNAQPPGDLTGALLGLLVRAGRRDASELCHAMDAGLNGALTAEERSAVMQGLLQTAPMLLWQESAVLRAVHGIVADLEDHTFLTLLPHLRRSFTSLEPHETNRLAQLLADILGISEGKLLASSSAVSEEEMMIGLKLDALLGESLAADGLEDWIAGKSEQGDAF